MRKCILPTDYSKSAQQAMEYALHLLHQMPHPVECILVHAYTAPATVPVYGYNPPGEGMPALKKEQQKLDDYLRRWQKRFPGLILRGRLLIGSFLTVMTNLIEEEKDVDMILMGTKGASGVEEVLLGSNAARAARSLSRPVFIIPSETPVKKPERVVFATDFQDLSDLRALAPIKELSRHFITHFLTLHVLPVGKKPSPATDTASEALKAYLENPRYSLHYLENDDTVAAIDGFLKKYQADCLVLFARERGFLASIFHRSVVQKMVFHTRIPLLVLKPF